MIMDLYQKITPLWARLLVYRIMARNYYRQYRNDLLTLYKDKDTREKYKEELTEITAKQAVYMINLPYKAEYIPSSVKVHKDRVAGMYYVLVDGKKLYYPSGWSRAQIKFYHNSLLTEMDERSPHSYTSTSFNVPDGASLIDLGGAEGIFTLKNIERIEKAYVFECDTLWEEPLKKTFEKWSGKVEIVPMFIGDEIKPGFTTLDAFIKDKRIADIPVFVKCDIEGAEETFLRGASESLASMNIELAICLYHRKDAEEKIGNLLKDKVYYCEYSKGYLFPVGFEKNISFPCFRRGVMRCRIQNKAE